MQLDTQFECDRLSCLGKILLVTCLLFSVADVNSAAPKLGKALSDTFHSKAIVGYRPPGVPKTWKVTPSDKNNGWKYINDRNKHTDVRVMPGQKGSPFPAQRRPYVVTKIHGQYINKEGHIIRGKQPGKTEEAHIPLLDFRFPTSRVQ